MLRYIFSFIFCLIATTLSAQEKEVVTENVDAIQDSIVYKTGYGIRLGIDISKPALSIVDKSYSGLEIVGDYRISKNWYLAAELGYEKETTFEDFLSTTANGTYGRFGANYNAYKNWLDMNNEIFVGFRYGISLFNQMLNSYSQSNTYFPTNTINPNTSDDLSAHWGEFQLGIKAEIFKNLFVSFSGAFKIMLLVDNPDNFKTLYAPGFNRVYASGTGFGFNYTISYLIPFVQK